MKAPSLTTDNHTYSSVEIDSDSDDEGHEMPKELATVSNICSYLIYIILMIIIPMIVIILLDIKWPWKLRNDNTQNTVNNQWNEIVNTNKICPVPSAIGHEFNPICNKNKCKICENNEIFEKYILSKKWLNLSLNKCDITTKIGNNDKFIISSHYDDNNLIQKSQEILIIKDNLDIIHSFRKKDNTMSSCRYTHQDSIKKRNNGISIIPDDENLENILFEFCCVQA